MVDVKQVDREAAANYLAALVPTMPELAERVRGNQTALARMFATQREAYEARIAELERERDEARSMFDKHVVWASEQGSAAESRLASYDALIEALNAIIDRGPERDLKWAGMSAKDIAREALKKVGR